MRRASADWVPAIGQRDGIKSVSPKIWNLQILDTTKSSLTIAALVNFTNPTDYSATVPFADVHIFNNGSLLGHATTKTITVRPGNNTNIPVTAIWDPLSFGGKDAHKVGVELLSQYISGYNTTITIRTHNGSIPSQPALGQVLSKFPVELPTPPLGDPIPSDPDDPNDPPKDGDDKDPTRKQPAFISDATMHLLTSSATFILHSPLLTSTISITHINATAMYHDDEVGSIVDDELIIVPPRVPTKTPRLYVDWSLGSVGYEAIRNAVGGTLKLSARATVGVRLGSWEEKIWFVGKGIGAKIRL